MVCGMIVIARLSPTNRVVLLCVVHFEARPFIRPFIRKNNCFKFLLSLSTREILAETEVTFDPRYIQRVRMVSWGPLGTPTDRTVPKIQKTFAPWHSLAPGSDTTIVTAMDRCPYHRVPVASINGRIRWCSEVVSILPPTSRRTCRTFLDRDNWWDWRGRCADLPSPVAGPPCAGVHRRRLRTRYRLPREMSSTLPCEPLLSTPCCRRRRGRRCCCCCCCCCYQRQLKETIRYAVYAPPDMSAVERGLERLSYSDASSQPITRWSKDVSSWFIFHPSLLPVWNPVIFSFDSFSSHRVFASFFFFFSPDTMFRVFSNSVFWRQP